MASSIDITQLSPSVAYLHVTLDAGAAIDFQQTGAVAPNKDLASLSVGPLKEYLTRLANWAILAAPAAGAKVRLRLIATSSAAVGQVVGGTQAVAVYVIQNGATAIQFHSVAGVTCGATFELALVHSAQR